jgi:type I restriction enzyme, S subunit
MKNWEEKTLNQISENLDSKRVPITKHIRCNGTIPYYGASGIVDYVEDYLFDEDLLLVSEDGANLLARKYPIAFSVSGKTWVNNHAHVLKFKNPVTQKFVEIYLNSIKLDDFVSGMAQPKLNQTMLHKIPIPLPPFPEQQRIVAILDEAFAAIAKAKANAEQNLKNAKELFESYLQQTFSRNHRLNGLKDSTNLSPKQSKKSVSSEQSCIIRDSDKGEGWEEKTLGEVCNVIGGGTPSKANSKFYDGDIYWATVRDMKGEIISDTEHKITKDAVKNSSTNIIPKGNVIIATRVGLGKVCLIENDTAINQDLRGVVPINLKKLSVEFLYRWFKSISHKIVEEGTGATVQGVKLPFIKSLVIYVPSLKEQQAIVQKLDALSTETKKLEAIYQQKINDLEELKKSVLQKAFSGQLSESRILTD